MRDKTSISTLLLIAATAAPIALLAGCSEDATTQAVAKAKTDVSNVGGGTGGEFNTHADAIYAQVESDLSGLQGKGPGGASEAAAVLLAIAHSGQSASLIDDAQQAAFGARERSFVVSATLSKWSRFAAQSEAASLIDVTAELTEISTLLGELSASRGAIEASKRSHDARLADLQAQMDNLNNSAKFERTAAGRIQLQLTRVPATTAATMAEQIRAHTLKADGYELEAQRLDIQLNTERTAAAEARLALDRITMQTDLLNRQRQEAETRAQQAHDDERSAGELATAAVGDLKAAADDLAGYLDSAVGPAFSKATREIRSGIKAAGGAKKVAKNSGSLEIGLAQQTLGQVERDRAQLLLSMSNLFERIADSGAIDTAGGVADELYQRAEQANDSANNAFGSAAGAYRRVRVRGDQGREVNQQIKGAADLLERLSETALGQVPNLAPPPAFDDELPDNTADDTADEDDWGDLDDPETNDLETVDPDGPDQEPGDEDTTDEEPDPEP